MLCLTTLAVSPTVASETVDFHNGSAFRFADEKRARKTIGKADDWVRAFGPMDRQMRLQVLYPVDEDEFLEFAAAEVRDWDSDEIEKVTTTIAMMSETLAALKLRLNLPKTIWLIQTTGHEESDAGGYTRGNAIIVPESQLRQSPDRLVEFFFHELFHVMTRHDPEIRIPLYEIIGFRHCEEIDYPEALMARKITNPDAFHFDTYIELSVNSKRILAVPLTLARPDGYDGGKMFPNIQMEFLELDRQGMQPLYVNGEPVLHKIRAVSGFFETIGSNTNYIVHPEEIMAVNFSMAVIQQTDVANPEILEAVLEVLMRQSK